MKRNLFFIIIMVLIVGSACADVPYESRRTLHSGYSISNPVSDKDITLLLSAAFSMPTGGNQRALDFYVVTDREKMLEMKGGNPYSQALDSAPCVIVIAADTEAAWYEELLEMDAGLSAGAILLEAADLGLTTCVLSIAPQSERILSVRSALDIPESMLPVMMIAVGYPEADAISGASTGNWSDEQVHWERNNDIMDTTD